MVVWKRPLPCRAIKTIASLDACGKHDCHTTEGSICAGWSGEALHPRSALLRPHSDTEVLAQRANQRKSTLLGALNYRYPPSP